MAYQVRQHTGRFPVAARRTTMRLWFWEITAPGSSDRLPFENDAWTHLNLEYQIRQLPVRFPVAARRTTIRLWFAEITASGSSYRFAFSCPRKGYVYSHWCAVPSSSSYRQVSCSCSEELPSDSGSGRYLHLVRHIVFIFSKRIRVLALMFSTKHIKLQAGFL